MRKLRLASIMLKGIFVKELLDKLVFLKDIGHYKNHSVEAVKIQGYLMYLKSIRTTRLLFISILGIGFSLLLLISGIILFHLALLLYAPWTNSTKMTVTLVSAGVYIIGSVGVFIYIFSERKWMEIFNADDIVDKIKRRSENVASAAAASYRARNGNNTGAEI